VIAGCSSAQIVLFDGTSYAAKLVGSDVGSDLAVLKIDAQGLSAAEFGNSNLVRVGDVVLAMGNPLGSELFGTMTDGIVSAINRDVNVDGYTMTLIQTTAALNPGNSGGALINESGQVVGITNLKMMSDYETIEGLGFAIPTVWAKEVVDVLLSDGAITGRPTLGITGLTIPTGQEETYGRDSGVYVNSVTANGPAAQAGVQPGDVITQANGQSVATIQDLTDVRDEVGVGGTLTLTVWRDGETLELTLTLVDQYELN
jgi:serine protease Do